MKTIFKPQYVYINGAFLKNQGILVNDNVIAKINDADTLVRSYPDAGIVEWNNMVMVPGTVNAHNHCFQSLLRVSHVTDRFWSGGTMRSTSILRGCAGNTFITARSLLFPR